MPRTFWYGLLVVVLALAVGGLRFSKAWRGDGAGTPAVATAPALDAPSPPGGLPSAANAPVLTAVSAAAARTSAEALKLIERSKTQEAIVLLGNALSQSPPDTDAAEYYLCLAVAYAKTAERTQLPADAYRVTHQLELALKKDPRHLGALKAMAAVRLRFEDLPGSIRYYRQALEVEPNDPDSWQQLADLYQRRGDLQAAEQAREQARTRRGAK